MSDTPAFDYDENGIDPVAFYNAVEESLMAKMEEKWQSYSKEQQERIEESQADRDIAELRAQRSQLFKDVGDKATDWDRKQLDALLEHRIRSDEMTPENFPTFVRDTWEEYERGVGEKAASLLKSQQRAPRTTTTPGATPGSKTPVTDFKSALAHMEEMFEANKSGE